MNSRVFEVRSILMFMAGVVLQAIPVGIGLNLSVIGLDDVGSFSQP